MSFFLKILSILAVSWDLGILRACSTVFPASWPALIALNKVRSHPQKSLSRSGLSLVPHAIIFLITESWKLSNSRSELNFFNWVTKSWKIWPSCCLYVKYLWQRMVLFFLRLQYFENLWRTGVNFILSPGSKLKASCISYPFWPIHVRKMKVFILSSLVPFSIAK